MRKLLLAPALALVLVAPTAAQAAATDPVVCEAPPEGTTVLRPNQTLTPAVASPAYDLVDYTWVDFNYQLDLSPAVATNKATITTVLNWTLDVNDYDLFLLDAEGTEIGASEALQMGPLESPPTEQISLTRLHCALFTVRVFNYAAPVSGPQADQIDPLELEVRAGAVR